MCQIFDEIFRKGREEGFKEGEAKQIIRIYQKQQMAAGEILEELISELKIPMKQAQKYMGMFGAEDYWSTR